MNLIKIFAVIIFSCFVAYGQEAEVTDIFIEQDVDVDSAIERIKLSIEGENYPKAIVLIKALLEREDISNYVFRLKKNHFMGANFYLRNTIASLPKEEIGAFKMDQNPKAKRFIKTFKETGDFKYLYTALQECFVSDHLPEILQLVAEHNLEQGKPEIALRYFKKLEDNRDSLDVQLCAKLFLTSVMSDSKNDKNKYKDVLISKYSQEKVSFAGVQFSISDYIKNVENNFVAAESGSKQDQNNKGYFISQVLWSEKLPVLRIESSLGAWVTPKCQPGIWHNKVIFNIGIGLRILDLETGKQIRKDIRPSVQNNNLPPCYPNALRATTIIKDTVYATIYAGANQTTVNRNNRFNKIITDLIAYDLKNDKLQWQLLEVNKDKKESLSKKAIISKPVYKDGFIYVEAIDINAIAENYIIAIDANTGKIVWQSFVSGFTRQAGPFARGVWEGYTALGRGNDENFCLTEGKIFYVNGYGVMSAININDGGIIWQRLSKVGFPRFSNNSSYRGGYNLLVEGWKSSSVFNAGSKIIFMPQNTLKIYWLDPDTGKTKGYYNGTQDNIEGYIGNDDESIKLFSKDIIELGLSNSKFLDQWGNYGTLQGKGLFVNGHYYLPLKFDKEQYIFVVRHKDKRIVQMQKIPDKYPLGDLFIDNGYLFMTTPTDLICFKLLENQEK